MDNYGINKNNDYQMDYNKLYLAAKDKILTDLNLTLSNHNQNIIINVHKIVLYSSCAYFEKMLTGFKEKLLNDILIEVPNIYITYDIIMSFYGAKN
jgi:hypothetical protein